MFKMEPLVSNIINSVTLSEFFYLIEARTNYFTGQLYEVTPYGTKGHNAGAEIFKKYQHNIIENHAGIGVILISKLDGKKSHKVITHYNQEIGTSRLFDLILFQEFNIQPENERAQIDLEKSIKLEKIKNTLVYSCYLNDISEITKRLEKTSKTQLNKAYCGMTPLGFCAKNDNLNAFKKIVSAGATIDKKTILKTTPLEYAFIHSPDIAKFIYSEYQDVFDENVKRKGFGIAYRTTDLYLLNLVLQSGADINCANEDFPPLHNCADFNNITGIKFLLESGADIMTLNKRKQTALERAIEYNNKEAAELLKQNSA